MTDSNQHSERIDVEAARRIASTFNVVPIRRELHAALRELETTRIRTEALCNAVEIIQEERDSLEEQLETMRAYIAGPGFIGDAEEALAVLEGRLSYPASEPDLVALRERWIRASLEAASNQDRIQEGT